MCFRNFARMTYFLFIAIFLIACSTSPVVQDSEGHLIRLKDYQGKWLLINYWASWCAPCIHEMPALNRLYQHHKNSLVVLGVNYDGESNDKLRAIQLRFAIAYPLLSQFPKEWLNVSFIEVVPTTFIINPQGKLVAVIKGPRTEQQFMALLRL